MRHSCPYRIRNARLLRFIVGELIVWGQDREEAIAKMRAALTETTLIGVQTVIPLHLAILNEPDFIARDVTIQYLEEHPNLLG